MIADQPQNRVRAILTARQRGVTGAAALLGFRQAHFGDCKLELVIAALLAARDLVAGELVRRDGILALDAGRHFAVGDALHLKRVQLAEIGDLVERQGRVLHEPDGGRLRHQRCVAHDMLLAAYLAPCSERKIGKADQAPELRLRSGRGLPQQRSSMTGMLLV